jgi:hypothetical protein
MLEIILGILLVANLTIILFDKLVDQHRYKQIYKNRKEKIK